MGGPTIPSPPSLSGGAEVGYREGGTPECYSPQQQHWRNPGAEGASPVAKLSPLPVPTLQGAREGAFTMGACGCSLALARFGGAKPPVPQHNCGSGFQLWFYFHLFMWVVHWSLFLRLPLRAWACPCEGPVWRWCSYLGCRGSGNTGYSEELAARVAENTVF